MLQICPKLPNQQFEKLPFKEAILTFLKDLSHSGEIKVITDVNVNKLHQPWRSFVAVINKCLSGAEPPKIKARVKKKQVGSDKSKTPPTDKGKRLKTSAKAAKTAKKKQPAKTSKAKGLTVLYEVALTEAEQMKLATKRSLIKTYSSHASGSGADEGTGGKPWVRDVPTYGSDDERISWKSSEEEDDDEVGKNDDDADNQDDDDNDDDDGEDNDNQDDDNEQTDSDNNGDD
ncbi:retrovirus-related pol polyprotein from transposon TNT 1-94 [Tanacetum coccineum]